MKFTRIAICILWTLSSGMLFPAGISAESTWTTYLSSKNVLSAVREGNVVWCGTDTGLFRLNPANGTFTAVEGPGAPAGKYVSRICVDKAGNKWMGVYPEILRFDGTEWKSWRLYEKPEYSSVMGLGLGPDNSVWAALGGGTFRFDGEQWVYVDNAYIVHNNQFVIAPDSSLWVLGESPRPSRFDGKSWTYPNPLADFHLFDSLLTSLAFGPDGSMWIGTNVGLGHASGGVYTIFTKENGLPNNEITELKIDSKGVVWAKTHNGGIARIEGNSTTAFTSQNGLASNTVNSIFIDTENNVWIATDRGLSRFGSDKVVTVEEQATPTALAITGNAPNPFNPSTTITLVLPIQGKAELTVYSVTGQRVRTLVSERMTTGTHSVIWDGRDDRGAPVASGVYLARLESGKAAKTAKMLLMK